MTPSAAEQNYHGPVPSHRPESTLGRRALTMVCVLLALRTVVPYMAQNLACCSFGRPHKLHETHVARAQRLYSWRSPYSTECATTLLCGSKRRLQRWACSGRCSQLRL
jgi:hypothetical protein